MTFLFYVMPSFFPKTIKGGIFIRTVTSEEFKELTKDLVTQDDSWKSPDGMVISYENPKFLAAYNEFIKGKREEFGQYVRDRVDVVREVKKRFPTEDVMSDTELNALLYGDATEWRKGLFYFMPVKLVALKETQKLRYQRENFDDMFSSLVARTASWLAMAFEGHVDVVDVFEDDPCEEIRDSPVETFHFADYPRRGTELLDKIKEAMKNGDVLQVTVTEEDGRKIIDVETIFHAVESPHPNLV